MDGVEGGVMVRDSSALSQQCLPNRAVGPRGLRAVRIAGRAYLFLSDRIDYPIYNFPVRISSPILRIGV